MSTGQVTYNLYPAVGQPGQLAEFGPKRVRSYPAYEVINPGRMVQIASDGISVQQVQNTSTGSTVPPSSVAGIALLNTMRQPAVPVVSSDTGAAYQIGDMVPVLEQGVVYAEWSSTTAQPIGTSSGLNVYHSSTTATNRGKITANTASATAGSEITPVPYGFVLRPSTTAGAASGALTTSGNICLLEVNIPGGSL